MVLRRSRHGDASAAKPVGLEVERRSGLSSRRISPGSRASFSWWHTVQAGFDTPYADLFQIDYDSTGADGGRCARAFFSGSRCLPGVDTNECAKLAAAYGNFAGLAHAQANNHTTKRYGEQFKSLSVRHIRGPTILLRELPTTFLNDFSLMILPILVYAPVQFADSAFSWETKSTYFMIALRVISFSSYSIVSFAAVWRTAWAGSSSWNYRPCGSRATGELPCAWGTRAV